MMRGIDEVAKADALLTEHYFWQKTWKPKIGYGNCAPECRESTSSRQWDSTADITRETADQIDMEAVDWCMDAITGENRQAIGAEMRNRESKADVWKHNQPYSDAVTAIMPFMRKKNLI